MQIRMADPTYNAIPWKKGFEMWLAIDFQVQQDQWVLFLKQMGCKENSKKLNHMLMAAFIACKIDSYVFLEMLPPY